MTDQHRADALGCAGGGMAETPNVDRIAAAGTRFARAACTSPLCAPSRASLASGLYPHRLGILGNRHSFPLDRPTYYQALRREGYRVAVVGKTDLHKSDHAYGRRGNLPVMYHYGFTDPLETEGKRNAGRPRRSGAGGEPAAPGSPAPAGPYQAYLQECGWLDRFAAEMARSERLPVWRTSPSPLPVEHYHDSFIGRRACEFLERADDESPWHLFVSFAGPHDPWDCPEAYAAPWRERTFPEPIPRRGEGKPRWVRHKAETQSAGMGADDLRDVRAHYAGAISLIDAWVGRMLDLLRDRGWADRTVVVFCSDHGEMLGDHGLFLKSVMYESAVRIPLIVSVPGQPHPGSVSDALVELIDLHPTLLELAGAGDGVGRLDARSLMPLLRGEAAEGKAQQIALLDHCRMICDREYKFIENINDRNELYRIADDPHESRNLVYEEPERAAAYLNRLKLACV